MYIICYFVLISSVSVLNRAESPNLKMFVLGIITTKVNMQIESTNRTPMIIDVIFQKLCLDVVFSVLSNMMHFNRAPHFIPIAKM
jgi:hypothetical protein